MPKLKKSKPAPKAKPSKVKAAKRLEKETKPEKKVIKAAKVKSNGSARVAEVRESRPAPAPKPPTAELLQIRAKLVQMLTALRKDIDNEVRVGADRDLAHINDSSDMATDSAEGDLALRIAESETVEAGEIERAIEKIDNGTYGSCEMCNKPINAERLQFLPFATMCIKCQELAEIRKKDEGDELDDLAEGTDDSENN